MLCLLMIVALINDFMTNILFPENTCWLLVNPGHVTENGLLRSEAWFETPVTTLFLITNEAQALDSFYQLSDIPEQDRHMVSWSFKAVSDHIIEANPSNEEFNQYVLYRLPVGYSKTYPSLDYKK